MSLVKAKGNDVNTESGSGVDLKNAFIRLKEGESVRVRLLTAEDYVEYTAHGSFSHGIYNTPCLAPLLRDCPLCKASKVGGDEWSKALYPKSRYLFAMADLDSGEVKVFDATRGQARGLIETINEYADELDEIAFTFKRTGNAKSTVYSLNAMTAKKFKDVKEAFEKFDEVTVDIPFYEERLQPKGAEYLVHLLDEAKFPIEEHFDAQLVAKSRETKEEKDGVKPVNSTDEDIKNM